MATINYLGGIYEGDVVNGVPHGKGTIKWDSGDEYQGQWKNGKMTGLGIRVVGDGHGGRFSHVQGYFIDGEIQYPAWVDYDEL